MAKKKALRFIDGNFRAQGWQGRSFEKWKDTVRKKTKQGTILINKGNLRRSFLGDTSPGQVRIYTTSPYARVHNRGFNGTVQVRAFTRVKFAESRIGTGRFTKNGTERTKKVHVVAGMTQVQAHQRQMNIPKRQFMPESATDSPVLLNAIRRDVISSIKSIFQ
jgi:phage gpG-like protein